MSDLRTRIANAIINSVYDHLTRGAALAAANAVIAELDLENRIASAVQGYAQSEMVGIDYHDPMRRETAYEAMQKLNREAVGIARYAMTYRPDWKADDE